MVFSFANKSTWHLRIGYIYAIPHTDHTRSHFSKLTATLHKVRQIRFRFLLLVQRPHLLLHSFRNYRCLFRPFCVIRRHDFGLFLLDNKQEAPILFRAVVVFPANVVETELVSQPMFGIVVHAR